MTESGLNVVVPASGIPSSRDVLAIADALLSYYGGQGTVLSVVEVPEARSLSEGALVVRRRRSLLRRVAQMHEGHELRPEVRTAHSVERGIRQGVEENGAGILLLGWKPVRRKVTLGAVERLVADPPCDLAAVKPGTRAEIKTILVPVRGGPHARLAARVAKAVAAKYGASLTLLRVVRPDWDAQRRGIQDDLFNAVVCEVPEASVRELELVDVTVEDALLAEAGQYDMVVMGAVARDARTPFLFGRIPEMVARQLDSTVVVVKTREPVTARTFGLAESGPPDTAGFHISEVVDRWFAENTYHSHEFRNLRYLVDLKERQGKTISVALPTLNEEKTVGKILATIKRNFVDRYPLVDELVVIDSDSEDRTVEIAEGIGIPVYKHPEILPQYGSHRGKGEGLWKGLYVTKGDIVVWIDSDISDFQSKFVYGLVGPLLTEPSVGFVKGFYRRPLNLGEQLMATGGGRVTELTARPLFNLFYPELSGIVQPLAGEMAGRREILESVPFFTGYGVETGLLIDILGQFGLNVIAQADLEYRVHRNQSLLSLSKMAFAIIQVVMQRLAGQDRVHLAEEMNTSMKLIHYSPTELFLEVKEIRENERPPIKTLPEYQRAFAREAALAGGPA